MSAVTGPPRAPGRPATEPAEDAAGAAPGTGPDAGSGSARRRGWRPLLLQPALLALGLLAFVAWRLTADLSETEARQLGWAALSRSALEHLQLTVVAGVIVVALAVPLGVLVTRGRLRRLSPLVLAAAGVGQAAPAIGLFVLLATWLGFGFGTAVVTLVAYAALPALRNTVVGLQGVDPRLVEAGRGMGMSSAAVLLRVELPLAVPVILAGVRTALVVLVGTATLATFIDGGGLGVLITTGITLALNSLLVGGAVLVALLALAVDWLGRVVEHVATPRGL